MEGISSVKGLGFYSARDESVRHFIVFVFEVHCQDGRKWKVRA